jgi:putative ABC transport system ATP-binding protein
MTTNSKALIARGIGKTVRSGDRDLVILRDIDLAVDSGEALAIVGASGSGKSTLLAILAGLDTPSAGSVELEGENLFELDEDARAELRGRAVGFVFQSFQLLPALSALENVMLPLELAGRHDAEAEARAVLERVGLTERLHHAPKHLSGGEQQLDAEAGREVIALLFELNRAAGTTLVMVTHDESLASRCDRTLRLEAGRVVP